MAFELANVVPWGRSYDEYVAMFALAETDLSGRILGCAEGPASFNAEASREGRRVVSADPIYEFSPAQIQTRIDETATTVGEQMRANADQYSWTHFRSVDELIETRMEAMRKFLCDYPAGLRAGRYITASLPELPFADDSFDLALCSHFLFLYAQHFSVEFHIRSLLELARTAREVRVFPLLELNGCRSRHLDPITEALANKDFLVETVQVPYEFQRGGNEMLRIARPAGCDGWWLRVDNLSP